MSPEEFSQKIRTKYPNAYQDIDDVTLAQKVVEKYPVYASQVNFDTQIQPQEQEGFLQRTIGKEVKETGERLATSFEKAETVPEKILTGMTVPLRAAGATARAGGRILAEPIAGVVSKAVEMLPDNKFVKNVSAGASDIAERISSGLEKARGILGEEVYQSLADTAEVALWATGARPAKEAVVGATKGTIKGAGALATGAGKLKTGATELAGKGISKITPESSEIMNRVARLKPTDASKFQRISGKTHGEYLTETGNFGSPDKILIKESDKFITSKNSVDIELGKLQGSFKDGSVTDALNELVGKAKNVSSENVKAPYLDEVLQLQKKYIDEGLSMKEINQVKRLYESKVRLGYNKLLNPDAVEKATNIDNALRNWQTGKAKELGFENITELNKQTQISKFMIDKLGDQVIGQSGLNGINLTDWIILSGGSPASLSGFLTKKFFSSKSVQSKIAEMLNKGDIQDLITPKITPSKQGQQSLLKKSQEKSLLKDTTKVDEMSSKKKVNSSLIQEAKKYKSADEFIKAQPTYYRGVAETKKFSLEPNEQGVIFLAKDKGIAESYAYKGVTKDLYPQVKNTLDLNNNATKKDFLDFLVPKEANKALKEAQVIANDIGYEEITNIKTFINDLKNEGLEKNIPKYLRTMQGEVNVQNLLSGQSKESVYQNWDKIIKKAKENGYDSIKHTTRTSTARDGILGEELLIFDKNAIKTKSQLKEIYNKAKGD